MSRHRATINIVGQGAWPLYWPFLFQLLGVLRKMIFFVSHVFMVDNFNEIEISSVTCTIDSEIEMVSIVVKWPLLTRSTVHVTKLVIWISLNLFTENIEMDVFGKVVSYNK